MKLSISVPSHQNLKQIDNRWGQVKMLNPFTARQAFAFCTQGDMGYLHGGYNSDEGLLKDMYMAKFNDKQQRQWYVVQQKGNQTPGKLRYHTLTSYLYFLICVGGQKSEFQNNGELFCFNLKTKMWSRLSIRSQSTQTSTQTLTKYLKRDSHCGYVYQKYLYIYGGYSLNQGQYSKEVLRLDLSKLQSSYEVSIKVLKFNNKDMPNNRANFASCIFKKQFYIFGGINFDEFFDDFWSFNFQDQTFRKINKEENQKKYWPQKRKGAVLVPYLQGQCLMLFGGMQNVTKQLNDLSVYLIRKNQWVKIHSFTNNIYDPSPTIKQQTENSPTMILHKNKILQKKKQQNKPQNKAGFRIGVISVSNSKDKVNRTLYSKPSSSFKDSKNTTKSQFNYKACKTQMSMTRPNDIDEQNQLAFSRKKSQVKMSVVKQKKYRQFLARKKKLLSQVCAGYQFKIHKRPFSPISQCLNFSINQLGQQHQFLQSKNPQFHLPKVIFDDKKSLVIGKKPCPRDGHAAFGIDKNMYIIGGDRHTVSFNDTHLFKMDKAVQSLNYYS